MKKIINRLNLQVERIETLTRYLLKRRRENIQKSLIRPLYQEILKSIFLVIIILIDTLVPLEIYFDFPNIVNILLSFLAIIIFLYVEMRIYNVLWGKNGRWSLEKYEKNSEKR